MKLYQVLRDYPILEFKGSAQSEILSLAYDSRRVLEGALFVCLVGAQSDGHRFVRAAVERRAAAILYQNAFDAETERWLDRHAPDCARIRVADSRAALAFVSANFHAIAPESLKLHLLIGDLGKGSCAQLLFRMLGHVGREAALVDEMQLRTGSGQRYLTRNHPEMPELCGVLSELTQEEVLLPLRYTDLALKRTLFLPCRSALILQARAEEAEDLLALDVAAGGCLVNVDDCEDEALDRLRRARRPFLSFGMTKTAAIRARELRVASRAGGIGTAFVVAFPDGREMQCYVALPGRHQVTHALAALAWAYREGLDLEAVADFLAELSLPGHSELLLGADGEGKGFTLLIDYAWSGLQIKGLLQSLRPYCRRRLLLLASAGGDREPEQRRDLALAATRWADYVCFTVSNPRSEGADSVLEDLRGFADPGGCPFDCLAEREAAIRHIIGLAEAGDMVVLSGKAREAYHIDAEETRFFSEYEVAMKALEERKD